MDGNRGVEMLAPDSASRQALRLLVDHQPERHDLVIGFVGPIGTAWKPVLRAFEDSLRRFDYDTKTVEVVGLLDELAYRPLGPLPDRDSRDYYERRMNAGDDFPSGYEERGFHCCACRPGNRETSLRARARIANPSFTC